MIDWSINVIIDWVTLCHPLSSADLGEVEQDVQHWSLEEAAEIVEEHGSS